MELSKVVDYQIRFQFTNTSSLLSYPYADGVHCIAHLMPQTLNFMRSPSCAWEILNVHIQITIPALVYARVDRYVDYTFDFPM